MFRLYVFVCFRYLLLLLLLNLFHREIVNHNKRMDDIHMINKNIIYVEE